MKSLGKYLAYISLYIIAITSACQQANAQINAEQVIRIGQNALYFDDYVLSIQYFNQAIQAKPYLAMPYFYRAIAKLNLDDYLGAENDATAAIERNPFIADAFEVRGVARQNRGNAQGAIDDYRHALELLPENRGLLFNLAIAQQDVKDYSGAGETYARLLKNYPRYDNGYMGRARLALATGDTIAAIADLDRTIELNKNQAGAYVLRAEIALKGDEKRLPDALSNLDEAIRLQPKEAGLYINRAFVRYKLDDYRGALADYETSITLDPVNPIPYFNRGLLRMETLDNDRALSDFTRVLQLKPDDYRALYNRATIYTAKKEYKSAIADISRVVDAFPDFPGAVYTRFSIYDAMGDRRMAMRDYDRAMSMFKKQRQDLKNNKTGADQRPSPSWETTSQGDEDEMARESNEAVSRRFQSLLTTENNVNLAEEHNNKNIRGKVQDRNYTITAAPMLKLSFYADDDSRENSAIYNFKDVTQINDTHTLRQPLTVTLNETGPAGEEAIGRHFQSVEYYNSYLATHTPRAVDYLGRGMDFMMLHNYQAAIADFTRAIELTPDFTLPRLMRAVARFKSYKAEEGAQAMEQPSGNGGSRPLIDSRHIAAARTATAMSEILADLDFLTALSPYMAQAHYNRGCMLIESGNLDEAIKAFSRAIELEPSLGIAYYNRGYVYLQQGDSQRGNADLSRAGELGIVSSYNLLKRMNK